MSTDHVAEGGRWLTYTIDRDSFDQSGTGATAVPGEDGPDAEPAVVTTPSTGSPRMLWPSFAAWLLTGLGLLATAAGALLPDDLASLDLGGTPGRWFVIGGGAVALVVGATALATTLGKVRRTGRG